MTLLSSLVLTTTLLATPVQTCPVDSTAVLSADKMTTTCLDVQKRRHGPEVTVWSSGKPKQVQFWNRDVRHGVYLCYDSSGAVVEQGLYHHGKRTSAWQFWNNGRVFKTEMYVQDVLTERTFSSMAPTGWTASRSYDSNGTVVKEEWWDSVGPWPFKSCVGRDGKLTCTYHARPRDLNARSMWEHGRLDGLSDPQKVSAGIEQCYLYQPLAVDTTGSAPDFEASFVDVASVKLVKKSRGAATYRAVYKTRPFPSKATAWSMKAQTKYFTYVLDDDAWVLQGCNWR